MTDIGWYNSLGDIYISQPLVLTFTCHLMSSLLITFLILFLSFLLLHNTPAQRYILFLTGWSHSWVIFHASHWSAVESLFLFCDLCQNKGDKAVTIHRNTIVSVLWGVEGAWVTISEAVDLANVETQLFLGVFVGNKWERVGKYWKLYGWNACLTLQIRNLSSAFINVLWFYQGNVPELHDWHQSCGSPDMHQPTCTRLVFVSVFVIFLSALYERAWCKGEAVCPIESLVPCKYS